MKVTVVRASPRRCEQHDLELPAGSTVEDAVAASGMSMDGVAGIAVFGERAALSTPLDDGDRVELLGPLVADPKDARRKRARRASQT